MELEIKIISLNQESVFAWCAVFLQGTTTFPQANSVDE
jgi:hypothetical protein